MKLTDKYTVEQINSAKKTITITTEIEGETHTEIIDGTHGYAVLTDNHEEETIDTRLSASGKNICCFAQSLLEEVARECPGEINNMREGLRWVSQQ